MVKVGDEIKVFAPATVANVACGFDVLGFAIDQPGDDIVLKVVEGEKVSFKDIIGDNGELPRNANKNSATVAIQQYLNFIGEKAGIEVTLYKKMPSGSGLGSSAASAVAAVYAINKLFDDRLTKEELLPFLLEAERAACDAAIADNVAASLFGGFILVKSYEPLEIVQLPVPDDLYCAVIFPHLKVLTKDARNVLPEDIPLKKSLRQSANLGGLITGLFTNNYGLIGRSLKDYIAEPYRAQFIPGFDHLKKAMIENGGLGGSISGSGPSVFSLSKGLDVAQKVGNAMQRIMLDQGIQSDLYISKVNAQGPKVY